MAEGDTDNPNKPNAFGVVMPYDEASIPIAAKWFEQPVNGGNPIGVMRMIHTPSSLCEALRSRPQSQPMDDDVDIEIKDDVDSLLGTTLRDPRIGRENPEIVLELLEQCFDNAARGKLPSPTFLQEGYKLLDRIERLAEEMGTRYANEALEPDKMRELAESVQRATPRIPDSDGGGSPVPLKEGVPDFLKELLKPKAKPKEITPEDVKATADTHADMGNEYFQVANAIGECKGHIEALAKQWKIPLPRLNFRA